MRLGRVVLVILLLAALGVAVFLWRPREERGQPVETRAAVQQPVFRAFVTASGEIVANRFAEIGANNMGRIVELPVQEGQTVQSGQLLARIDPIQASADLEAFEAQVRSLESEAAALQDQVSGARFQLEQARALSREALLKKERLQNLFDEGVVSRSELDTAIANADSTAAAVSAAQAAVTRTEQSYQAARRRIAQAEAQTKRVQDVFNKTEIRSPIQGTVTRLDVREGEMVVIGIQNQPGTRLMTISDLSDINAEVQVAEAEILSIEVGQVATVTLEAFPERTFRGKVVQVGASAITAGTSQAAAREFRVVIQLDDPDTRLKPGLTCDAEIQVAELQDVVTVPLQAVVLRDMNGTECTGVFVARDGVAEFREVEASVIGGLDIVVSGVEPGELVVSGPYQLLRELQDGARINPQQP